MVDGEIISILTRIALALERLADRHAPIEGPREKRPATLGKAIYNREEREKEQKRKAALGEEPD